MRCEDVEQWIWSTTAADLDRGDRMDARMHIAGCPACSAAEREARSLDARVLAAVQSEPVDTETVCRNVLAQLRGRRKPSSRIIALRVAAALLLFITAAGAWVSLRLSTPLETLAEQHHREEVLGDQNPVWITEQTEIVAMLSTQMNSQSGPAILVSGGRLRGARLCRLGGARQVHLLLEGRQGPVSVFLCRDTGRRNVLAAGRASAGSLRSAAVASDQLTVIVVGPMSEDEAERLAGRSWSALAI